MKAKNASHLIAREGGDHKVFNFDLCNFLLLLDLIILFDFSREILTSYEEGFLTSYAVEIEQSTQNALLNGTSSHTLPT